MSERPLSVGVIGSNAYHRELLAEVLRGASVRVVWSTASVTDVPAAILPVQEQLLIIINAGYNPAEAIDQVKQLKGRQIASWRVAVLANKIDIAAVISTFQAGANAYLVSCIDRDTLVKSLELVMLGQTIVPEDLLSALIDFYESPDKQDQAAIEANSRRSEAHLAKHHGNIPELSLREKHVLHCLIEGDSNKVIARKTGMAEATVKVHLKAILRKIRAQNRTQAGVWALEHAANLWPPLTAAVPSNEKVVAYWPRRDHVKR